MLGLPPSRPQGAGTTYELGNIGNDGNCAPPGHRMAGVEPTAAAREIGRRQLRGEITGDKAVEIAVAAALAECEATQTE